MKKNDKEYLLIKSVLLAGSIITASGGETFRAEDTMCRMLAAGGASEADVTALSTSITLSYTDKNGEVFSTTKRIKSRTINLGRIASVNELSRRYCSGSITIEELYSRLLQVESHKEYPEWLIWLCAILTPSAFTILLSGSLADCIVAGINGAIIALITRLHKKLVLHPAIFNVLIGILIALASCTLNHFLPLKLNLLILLPSSIMALLPGVTLTNAVHDLLNADFMSGGARLMEALVTATTLAVGIGFGLALASTFMGGIL
ncbi:MAG: threonine/serine exporter family protein [Clostridia bacterium]|nr:threonine/serine exporter family protein [Clostridia bacterium]